MLTTTVPYSTYTRPTELVKPTYLAELFPEADSADILVFRGSDALEGVRMDHGAAILGMGLHFRMTCVHLMLEGPGGIAQYTADYIDLDDNLRRSCHIPGELARATVLTAIETCIHDGPVDFIQGLSFEKVQEIAGDKVVQATLSGENSE